MIAGILSLQAQSPRPSSDQPRFDVASIKVNTANDRVVFSQSQKGRYAVVGFTLGALIRSAYRVQEFQIIGGPDWIDSERFNVEATYADVEDLTRDVGFAPATPIEEGIARFVRWYREFYKK